MRGADLWPAPIWAPLYEHTERAIATGERQSYDLATNMPNHGPSVREWTVVPLVGESGKVERILTMSTDVTQQRQLLAELREADQRKSEFIAVLSHELRNPLAAIKSGLHRARARRARQRGGHVVAHDHRSPGRPAGAPGRRSAGRQPHHPAPDPAAAQAAGRERAGARHHRGQPRASRTLRRPGPGPGRAGDWTDLHQRRQRAPRAGADEPAHECGEVHARRRDRHGVGLRRIRRARRCCASPTTARASNRRCSRGCSSRSCRPIARSRVRAVASVWVWRWSRGWSSCTAAR